MKEPTGALAAARRGADKNQGKPKPEKSSTETDRISRDATLERAADILLGLKALGVNAAGKTANSAN